MVNWTELRIAKLKWLHKEGLSAGAIGKKLGPAFTKGMVIRKIHRLGLNKKPAKAGAAKKLKAPIQTSPEKAHPRKPASSSMSSVELIVVPPPTQPRSVGTPELSGRELFELRAGQCRFPLGDDRPARLFCGAPAVGTSSWCEYHQRIVFPNLAPPKHRSRRQNPHAGNRAAERPTTQLSGGPRAMAAARPQKFASDDPPRIALEGAAGVA